MIFLYNLEKILKNGFFIDFLIKNLVFFFYKKIIGQNLLFLVDKYFTEYLFINFKNFFNYIYNFINILKQLNSLQIIKILLILIIQILVLILL